MALIEIQSNKIVSVEETTFAALSLKEREDLQRLLRDRIDVIDSDLLVIGEEFSNWHDSSRRIDLLCLDREKNLVVIEIKRDTDGGHMDLQAIRYAAMVHQMTLKQAADALGNHLARRGSSSDARQVILDHLGCKNESDAVLSTQPRIILVSQDFNSEITTAVLWLRNEFDMDISCVRLTPHKHEGRIFVNVEQIIPLPEASDFMLRQREKTDEVRRIDRVEDSPYWFFNVGMSDENWRDWENCQRYGFLSAGGGTTYSAPLSKLKVGDPVFAFQKDRGYVGYGIVETERQLLAELPMGESGAKIGTVLPEVAKQLKPEPVDDAEFAVGVRWMKTFSLPDARWEKGLFANQWTVCRLTHRPTLAFLLREFEVKGTELSAMA